MFDRESGRYLPPDGTLSRPQHKEFGEKYGELFGQERERGEEGDGQATRLGRLAGNGREEAIDVGRMEDSTRGAIAVGVTLNAAVTSAREGGHEDAKEAGRTIKYEGNTDDRTGRATHLEGDRNGPTLLRREEGAD